MPVDFNSPNPHRVCDLSTIARETERLSANGRVAPGVGEVFRAASLDWPLCHGTGAPLR